LDKLINPGNAKAFLGFSLLIFQGNSAQISILFILGRKDSGVLRLKKEISYI
jgi:hypothetical protein